MKKKLLREKLTRIEAETPLLYDLKNLEQMGGQVFVDKMVRLFLTEMDKDLIEIQKNLVQNNFEGVRSIAHKVKPSIHHICVEKLYLQVLDIELWKDDDEEMIKKTNVFIDEIFIVIKQLLGLY